MKYTGALLRALCSAALLGYLLMQIDYAPLAEVLQRFRPPVYVLALLTMTAYVFAQSYTLHALLGMRGIPVGFLNMARYNFISSFFGVFLPGGAGADVVMVIGLCRTETDKAGVLGAVAFARVAGLIAMIFLAFVVSLTPWCPVPGVRGVTGLILVAVLSVVLLIRTGVIDAVRKKLFGMLSGNRVTSFVDRLLEAFTALSASGHGLLRVAPFFLLMALGRGAMDCLVARSLGVDLSFPSFLVFSTVVSLATLLPISIAGLGVRELTFAGLFATVGVPQEVAVSVSLLSFSLTLWVCLVGGVLYAMKGWRRV